jgi:hypothetical protein
VTMSKITVGLREFFLHTLLLKGFSHKAIGQELPVFLLGRHAWRHKLPRPNLTGSQKWVFLGVLYLGVHQ